MHTNMLTPTHPHTHTHTPDTHPLSPTPPLPPTQDKKGGKAKASATISKEEPCESFFNFFR